MSSVNSQFLFVLIFTYSGIEDFLNAEEGSIGEGGDSSSARESESSNRSASTNGENVRKRSKKNNRRYESRKRSALKLKKRNIISGRININRINRGVNWLIII